MNVYRVAWRDPGDQHTDHDTQAAADAHQDALARAGRESICYEIGEVEG